MKSHDCTRLSGSMIRLCAFIRCEARASVCSHPPRYGIYTPLAQQKTLLARTPDDRLRSTCVRHAGHVR
eukprot:4384039-Prymnesium_polylepis.1